MPANDTQELEMKVAGEWNERSAHVFSGGSPAVV